MDHHISQTMSQEGSSKTGTGCALEEPEWRYNRKEHRFIVTFKASVSVEQEDGTTLVRAAHRTTPDNLLCAWEELAKEAGLNHLRKATKGRTGVSVLKDKLAQVFKSASQEWWESLSGVNLVTITENPGSPNAERVPGTRKYLDVPLADGEVDLESSSQPKCKTLRLKVIGLREHQYRIPVPTLTYSSSPKVLAPPTPACRVGTQATFLMQPLLVVWLQVSWSTDVAKRTLLASRTGCLLLCSAGKPVSRWGITPKWMGKLPKLDV